MDFEQKARLVTGLYINHPPAEYTYTWVVYIESVCIILTLSALNNLDVYASNIQNTYLISPYNDKIIIVNTLQYEPCKDDPDVWIRISVK